LLLIYLLTYLRKLIYVSNAAVTAEEVIMK